MFSLFFSAVFVFVVFFSTSSKTGQRSQSYTLTTTTSHVSSRFVRVSEMILIKNSPQALEKIYKTTDWPPTYNGPAPSQSLRHSGKSRADLWAFAGLVTHTAHYWLTFADFQGLAKDDGFSFNFIMVHSHCVYDIHSLGQLSHHIDRMPVGKLVH